MLKYEVLLTAKVEITLSKYACIHMVATCSIKGHGQILARVIVCVTACRPVKKGAYFMKSVRTKCRHSDFD